MNLTAVASDFRQIFSEVESPSLSRQHLDDPKFIELWFQAKLLPLLPDVPRELLTCLSTKNFSCQAYQAIVAAFRKYNYRYSYYRYNNLYYNNYYYGYSDEPIYKYFIYPFLLNHNTSDPQCVSSANNTDWLTKNFGDYLVVPSIDVFYKLNPNFSGLEVLHLLTSKQIAEMLLLPLPTPPEKDVVIDRVFDFLLESPENSQLSPGVLRNLRHLSYEMKPPCDVFKHIFERLYAAIPLVPRDIEPDIWTGIEYLRRAVPDGCLPANLTCQAIPYNDTNFCRGVNSSDLLSYENTSMEVPCSFSLEKYACAQLENFTANKLVSLLKCNLPGNSRNSKGLWKLLLMKLSFVLDPALDILANMSTNTVVPAASAVLDVIGEIRVSMLTDEQLMNSSVIGTWFSGRLRVFLPSASKTFLQCLSTRNLSCDSYQQILQEYIHRFDTRNTYVFVEDFILPFLSQPHSGPGCVSASNGSAEWLMKNLGPFSHFLNITQLFRLNPDFKPLDVLPLLHPAQNAELLVLILPDSPEKDVIMNKIFDILTPKGTVDFIYYLILYQYQLKINLSCSTQKILFTKLDLIKPTLPLYEMSFIMYYEELLIGSIPPGCFINRGECIVTMTNETDICVGVNRTKLQLDGGQMDGRFCDFAVEELACASLTALRAEDLAALLACNRSSVSSGSRPAWKLLLSKASHVLDGALDLLTNTTLDPGNPAVPMVLDSIREIRLDSANLTDPAFIQLWFQVRLRPFLHAVTPHFLSCLTTKGLNCTVYQHMVQILSRFQPRMTLERQIFVYKYFMKTFLTRNNATDSSCSAHVDSSGEWLQKNLGGFSALASFRELQMLYSNFSAMAALPLLTVRQLAEVSATPDQLTSPAQVTMVMKHVPDRSLPAFFDDFSPAIMSRGNQLPSAVRSAMLQVVFDRANLSHRSVGDSVVSLWLRNRLRPLLGNLSIEHVAPFFGILAGRNCSVERQGIGNLNSTISSLSEETKKEIFNHIVQTLEEPIPLSCYNDSHSFYSFLQRSFMGFQFPNLTTVLSLMPRDRTHQLLNSVPPSALGDFLRRPDVVDDAAELCVIYDHYNQTPTFLQTESLPAGVRRPTLPCVWPSALSSSERSEVNAWFDQRLQNYLRFLTKSLISPNSTRNASCLAFQKLVSVLGEYNYTGADFMRRDVFDSVRAYLASATVPRCYDSSDPELNSTAWFAEYIGPFVPFLTLEDLQTFGSAQVLQVFAVNPLNLAVLNHTTLPANLTDYYTELVYQQDGNFNPLLLPLSFRCVAPGPAFSQLSPEDSMIVLYNLTTLCVSLDPQVSAALAGNLGDNIDAMAISALGGESSGMSTGQIKNINPQQMLDALGTLGGVMGWREGQAKAIVQSLMSSGAFQINSTSLLLLGSLVMGIPAKAMGNIAGSQLLTASKDPSFLEHLMSAPQIVQQTFVAQIISADSNVEAIVQNVPDEMATEIPRALLLGFSNNASVIEKLNKKKWKHQQVELFFDVVAVESATAALGGANNLSSSLLQGFTCTGVRTVKSVQIKKLIRACRRKGKNKVTLVETQLTCMYNHIKEDSDAAAFALYPPDMLLYYDYSLVPAASCRSYFEQLSEADFSVFSPALSYKRTALFANARSCLGITNTSLTEDNISVLGNMCCTLDGSYIENSDPSILEKLNLCLDLTDAQAAAVEALLLRGKTPYGTPSTWTEQTLKDLDMLPLYLTSTFYDNFDKKTKRRFLRYFLKVLRSNGVDRMKRRTMKKEVRKSIRNRSKRSTDNECTVGTITQVTISDETFPFDYDDIAQFNCCLSGATVRDNLEGIVEKVDQEEYLHVVLSKLREVYSTLPEDQVQLLGPASRVATTADVDTWTVTQIDTLAALMDSSNGQWDPSLAKAVVSKYLSHAGNKLGSDELNSIGGANLCSLDADVLRNISQQSIREADALTVSNCTAEKKKELFTIAEQAFASNTRSTVSVNAYQLTKPYIGGANSGYVRSLAASNINMDVATFTSLDENVVLNLTVSEVKGLLGTNLADLQSYQNQTLVQNWISRQSQAALNTLGIGLTGGRVSNTTTNATTTTGSPSASNATTTTGSPTASNATTTTGSPTASNATTTTGSPTAANATTTTGSPMASNATTTTGSPTASNATTTTGSPTASNATTTTGSPTASNAATTTGSPTASNSVTTTSTTTGNGARLRADAGFSFLALLALLMASLV
ncbi:uncharacterized protein [Clinocottus analis]|uniref:uncharacterized protein isoform X2 n=1 Tax=Clinocottus analis TaxID=304258 RepID=UPI0035C207EA